MDDKRLHLIKLLDEAEKVVRELDKDLAASVDLRSDVISRLKSLMVAVRSPFEQVFELITQPLVVPTVVTALEAGWLDELSRVNDGSETALGSSKSHSGLSVRNRLLRFLSSQGVVQEVDHGVFASTALSDLICNSRSMAAGLRYARKSLHVCVSKMPEYFAENEYQEPADVDHTLFAFAFAQSFWHYLESHEDVAEQFDLTMNVLETHCVPWFKVYPMEKLRVDSEQDTVLVDIGGGKGHDLANLAAHMNSEGSTGKLVLQDKAEVIGRIPTKWRELYQVHVQDFFTPQAEQFRHAKTYYMRRILHDWSDAECQRILSNVRDAMMPEYSRLLINELILPDRRGGGGSTAAAASDMVMMTLCGGKERTEPEWQVLIHQVDGLIIEKIWALEADGRGLIEVVRKH